MKATDINKASPHLKVLIKKHLKYSDEFVKRKCRKLGNSPQEPDFIASLTLIFTPGIFHVLKALFPKNKFSVTGVFCHQAPLANIGSSKNTEIGDLLLVYIYTDNRGIKILNSLLFQAKVSNKLITRIPATDKHQLKLYSEWPVFTYKRAGIALNGKRRDIQPKTINDGAQYLLIDKNPLHKLSVMTGKSHMGVARPARTLYRDNDLADEIIDFLKFKAGRAFEENPMTTNDDWTKMIWDLLSVTKVKASKRKNAGLTNFPRQVSNDFDGCCFIATETNSIFQDLHKQIGHGDFQSNSDNYFDEENFSPSVILIECSEQDEEQKNGS